MMAVIEAQQAQIDAMRAELNALKAAAHRRGAGPGAGRARRGRGRARRRRGAVAAPPDEDDRTEAQMVAEGFTWNDQSGRSLTLSGQINPAFNVVDDGISTDVFIVDNDTSGTRFRLDVDAPLGETSIGAHPRDRREPEQLLRRLASSTPQTDADFNVRRAEVTFRNDRYGRLQLGKGSSAADDTAEYDLSLVAGLDHVRGRRRHRRRHPLHRRRLDTARDTAGRATPSSTSTATGWRASATTARCSARCRARSPTARTTSGRPR